MNYTQILKLLGACGLNCGKCFAFEKGSIRQLSNDLKEKLGNFDVFAQRFVELLQEPVFLKYQDFREMLAYFSRVKCQGCRNDECKLFTACKVKQCAKDHSVDFCFQCREFPCDKHGFDKHLEKRWIRINLEMKKKGVEEYYRGIKDQSRYQ